MGNSLVMSEKSLIARRALYCGVASLIALALAFALEALSINHLDTIFWGVRLDNVIYATLPALAVCVGTVLALRKTHLITLSVITSFIIGFINHRVARQVLWLLYPSNSEIGLGRLGQFIDQHYSMIYGFDAGALVGSFLASLLVAFFCAALQRNWRMLMGGFIGGFIASSFMFLTSIWTTEASDPGSLFVWIVIVAVFFVYGVALGGSIALGEQVGFRFSIRKQNGVKNIGSRAA